LQTKEKSLLTLQTSKAHLQQQIKEHTDQLLQQEQEKRKLTSTIEELDKNIASIDTKKIEQLKQEKATHYATQTSLEAGSNLFRITHSETISTLLGELPEKKEGLSAIVLLIQTLKDC
jgi:phage shock protein A